MTAPISKESSFPAAGGWPTVRPVLPAGGKGVKLATSPTGTGPAARGLARLATAARRTGTLLALVAWLGASHSLASTTVQTLTGGPSQFNGHSYGYVDGNTAAIAQFNFPCGLALDPSGTFLFVADCTNNAVRVVSNPANAGASITTTMADNSEGIYRPVAVVVDSATNVYVLNHGDGQSGSVLEFNASYYVSDGFAFPLGARATGLTNATALALDGRTNLYITIRSNTVIQVTPAGVRTVVGTITNAGTSLRGIAVLDDGRLALTDGGNHGIWVLNPATGTAIKLTGFRGPGDLVGPPGIAAFYRPEMIAKAGGGLLVVADRGNHKVKTIDAAGNVSRLYGVSSNLWVQGSPSQGIYPGWWDGEVCSVDTLGCPEARDPFGVVVTDGTVYTSEVYYHLLRRTTAPGLAAPLPGYPPFFNHPAGLALDASGTHLFVADTANNAVEVLSLADNQVTSFLGSSDGLVQPVDVLLGTNDNLFVLNQGTGGNGSVLQFDRFGNLIATNAVGLAQPTAFALNDSGNLLVAEAAGTVRRFDLSLANVAPATNNLLATVPGAGVHLQGIAIFDDLTIVVSDAAHDVLWQINPVTRAATVLSGKLGTPGNALGAGALARLNQPQRLARAANGLLVAADCGNNRLVIVDRTGAVTNVLNATNGLVWFGVPGDPNAAASTRFVPMVAPVGVVVASGGAVYASETYYEDIRELLGTGLTQAGPVGAGTGTNALVAAPILSPNAGYYPMGQWIQVSSTYSNVFYSTDGTEPSATSRPLADLTYDTASQTYVGFIPWVNSLNDLTSLRVKAFLGTNASATVSGQPSALNTIGIPPDFNPSLQAGIGSTLVVPIVVNLNTNAQIQSFQFRVEIAPVGNTNAIGDDFLPLLVQATDFIPLATPSRAGTIGMLTYEPYSTGTNGFTNGLVLSAIGTNAGVSFRNYATVALLEIPIPAAAQTGDHYSLAVTYPSATSDGLNNSVPLTPMPPVSILVTNVPYTVGDSAAPWGGWYNAGTFGNGDLDNADVNNAFYAALGLRVPFAFSDIFNALDAYPPDGPDFTGGDGQIRFLDWQLILARSLRQDTNNWARQWSTDGRRTSLSTGLSPRPSPKDIQPALADPWPWYRQALVGALPVSSASPGAAVQVPVYVTLSHGATLSGLQFRALVTPPAGAPALASPPGFLMAPGLAPVSLQLSLQAGQTAFGWSLGSFNFASAKSNFLGWLTFTLPPNAPLGQAYTVTFANTDGAPDAQTQYDLETRGATVAVGGPALPTSICSDDWKLHFFGSLSDPRAADLADPDGDRMPNWMEYLAGTDPTDRRSFLRLAGAETHPAGGQIQTLIHWLTAPGKVYEVQWSPNATGPTWQTLGTVTGDGTVATCPDATTAAARFYRLRLLP